MSDSPTQVSSIHDITMLNLEFNSSCNLRCKWCALDHGKKREIMSKETLTQVLDNLADGQLPGIKYVDLHNGGETLLHPNLPEMFTIIRNFKMSGKRAIKFRLLTNAMLLTPKVSEQIVRSRAVDQLRFSLDGGTPELFESIRKGASWEKVQSNIYNFIKINIKAGRPLSTEGICMIPLDHPANTPLAPRFKTLFAMLDKTSFRHPHNWDGSEDLKVDDSFFQKAAAERQGQVCFLLKRNLVVLPDGQVTVCCNDLNKRGVIGSVQENNLDQLAMNPLRLKRISLFSEGKKNAIKLCKDCTGFYSK